MAKAGGKGRSQRQEIAEGKSRKKRQRLEAKAKVKG